MPCSTCHPDFLVFPCVACPSLIPAASLFFILVIYSLFSILANLSFPCPFLILPVASPTLLNYSSLFSAFLLSYLFLNLFLPFFAPATYSIPLLLCPPSCCSSLFLVILYALRLFLSPFRVFAMLSLPYSLTYSLIPMTFPHFPCPSLRWPSIPHSLPASLHTPIFFFALPGPFLSLTTHSSPLATLILASVQLYLALSLSVVAQRKEIMLPLFPVGTVSAPQVSGWQVISLKGSVETCIIYAKAR